MERVNSALVILFLGVICFFILILGEDDNMADWFSAPIMAVKFFACGLVLMIGSIYYTKKFYKVEKVILDIESIPLSKTDRAVDGVPFAGVGVIEPENGKILRSPYKRFSCVYFHSIKELYFRTEFTEWIIVENIARFVPFYIRDERGRLKIDLTNMDDDFSNYKIPLKTKGVPNPKNSEIDCDPVIKHKIVIEKSKKGFFTKKKKYRISEFVLRPGTKVFVYGMVSKRNNELVLHEDERCPLIISKKSRDRYIEEFYYGESLVYLSHFLVSIGFTMSLLSISYLIKMDIFKTLFLLIIGNAIILGSLLLSLFNRLITLKNRALAALGNIKGELKRRADLIPNIVEIVKAFAEHEKEIQNILTEGRAKISFSKRLKQKGKPVIKSLAMAIEKYPQLKAVENFQSLMHVLIDTEERLAYSREYYNRTVRKFNTLIKQYPFSIIARLFRFKEMEFVNIAYGG